MMTSLKKLITAHVNFDPISPARLATVSNVKELFGKNENKRYRIEQNRYYFRNDLLFSY
jgi:hypothetical protein